MRPAWKWREEQGHPRGGLSILPTPARQFSWEAGLWWRSETFAGRSNNEIYQFTLDWEKYKKKGNVGSLRSFSILYFITGSCNFGKEKNLSKKDGEKINDPSTIHPNAKRKIKVGWRVIKFNSISFDSLPTHFFFWPSVLISLLFISSYIKILSPYEINM